MAKFPIKCCNAECEDKTERIVPFSCETRIFCPSCGQRRALLWAERMVEEVLPDVPYAAPVCRLENWRGIP